MRSWTTILLAAVLVGRAFGSDEPPGAIQAFVEKGRSLRLAGRFDLAQSALESAQLEAKTLGDAAGGARALNELGRLRLLQSELDQALESYQEALAGCEAAGDRSCEAAAVLGLGRDQFSVALWAVVLPDGGFSVGMKMRHSQERNQPVSVSVALRVERLEPSGRSKAGDTARAAVTHSNAVEWTRNAGARVTPFNLQRSVVRAGFGSRRIGNAPNDA